MKISQQTQIKNSWGSFVLSLVLLFNLFSCSSSLPSNTSEMTIPKKVTHFIQQYEKDVVSKDIERIMNHYSDDFYLNGRDKEGTKKFWNSIFKHRQIKSIKVKITSFKHEDNKAHISGQTIINGRRRSLAIPMIINEKGTWKWYGSESKKNQATSRSLIISFADADKWNGKAVPKGQQCQKFGGKPLSPRILVEGIPKLANAIIMEYSDRSYPPMDNGGHGKIGYRIKDGASKVVIPSIPGHSFQLPGGFFLVMEHLGASWDKAGAYMPPCSGGMGNEYYVTIKAVQQKSNKDRRPKVLSKSVLEMGIY